MIPRLKDLYYKKIATNLMKQHNLKNINEVPVLEKIVINTGVGEAKDNPKLLTAAVDELTAITGQKATVTRAKKSISNFKLRKGMTIGTKVTLRSDKMWEFFDRFVNIALPRVRDFRGLSPEAFDKFNNYSIGIKEQLIFPEVNYDKVEKIHGLDITFVIKNRERREIVIDFLENIGMPFRKMDTQDAQGSGADERVVSPKASDSTGKPESPEASEGPKSSDNIGNNDLKRREE